MSRVNNTLVLLIIILSAIVSAYGFFFFLIVHKDKSVQTINGESVTLHGKGLYHKDSVSGAAQARAQDIVTLTVGIPVLFAALILSNKNSLRGKLLLTGTVGYFLYTYVSYSFLAMYNKFFLVYVALMSLSLFCFLINITSAEFKNLEKRFKEKFPRRYIGVSVIIIGTILCLMWLGMIVPSINEHPAHLEHYTTMVIQALDLGLIVPAAILSGVLLIKNKSAGYLLAPIIIIKGAALLMAIVMMIIFMLLSKVDVSIIEMIIFPLFAIICVFNVCLILKNTV
jgi:hypothetical protein